MMNGGVEEIIDRGDQYAKRMLVRKRESNNQSPECYSKSLRRRLSIMEAINKSNITIPPTNLHYDGNPFQREFHSNNSGISEEIERHHVKIPSPIKDDLPSSQSQRHQTHDPESSRDNQPQLMQREDEDRESSINNCRSSELCNKSHDGEIDDNYNSIDYCNSTYFQMEQNLAEIRRESSGQDNRANRARLPRMSMGEYFRSSAHKDVIAMGDSRVESTNRSFEDEFERGNAELERQGADVFFSARVLEILEPEVVSVERKSSVGPLTKAAARRRASEMALVEENFEEMHLEDEQTDGSMTVMSFGSEDIREIDREIDKLEFQPDVLDYVDRQEESQPVIVETPKSKIYPNLDLVRRMSDNFTPKKLFHAACLAEKTSETIDGTEYIDAVTNHNVDSPKTCDELLLKASSPPDDTSKSISNIMLYRSPMPIVPSAPEYTNLPHLHYEEQQLLQQSSNYAKQHRSFLILSNEHQEQPKISHSKPNLESTRKIFSNDGKTATVSPNSNTGISMISTITLPNTPSSPTIDAYETMPTMQQPQHQVYRRHRQNDGTLPFEVENFLELALGDEHCNSSVTYAYSEMRDRTNSHINASELLSEDRTPMKKRNKSNRVPSGIEPSKNRSTLDRTLSIYKTLTQRIKKRFRGSVSKEPEQLQQSRECLPNTINPKELKENVKKLLSEVDIQQTLIYQASKALELCNSMRAFAASPERVESERLLMLANLRKKAAQEEIGRLTSQSSDNSAGLYCERGEVTLKDLSLQLRDDVLRRERQGGDIAEWFVCVVTEGSTVWATQAVECPTSSPRLYFPSNQLTIPGLPPNFRLTLTIYSLKMPKQSVFNHEDKYRIQNGKGNGTSGGRSRTCPSPKTLLKRSEKNRRLLASPKQHEIRFSGIQESSFVVSGSVDLMLHDLNLKSPWPLMGVPRKSVLHGTIDLSLSCRLELSVSHAGFLTHGEEAGGLAAWNRRWCVLEGHSLFFWNYPREQECKPPLYSIDLVNCVSRRIGLIDRTLCAKPRTLLIETARSRSAIDRDSILVECRSNFTIVRALLSCDTNQDLTEWQSKLNHAISVLREWNIIDTKLNS